MRPPVRLLTACVLISVLVRPAGAGFVDAVLAEVGRTTIAASDIALARGLGLFGFTPSEAPIQPGDVERYIDARLVVLEATQLGIESGTEGPEEGWRAAAGRVGGLEALTAWLAAVGIGEGWARRAVLEDHRWRRFIELRFREMAFVSEAEVSEVLGSGPDDPGARERVRERLRAQAAARARAAWLEETRGRVPVRRLLEGTVPTPFPMPPRAPAERDPG